jgi:hypothetical protein
MGIDIHPLNWILPGIKPRIIANASDRRQRGQFDCFLTILVRLVSADGTSPKALFWLFFEFGWIG